jgi:DNA-binding CsgD family transcriptional regulator
LSYAAGKTKAAHKSVVEGALRGLDHRNNEPALADTDRIAPVLRLILATFTFYVIDDNLWTGTTFFGHLTNTKIDTPPLLHILYLLACPVLGFFAGRRARGFLRVFYPLAAFFFILTQALRFTHLPELAVITDPVAMLFALGVFISLSFILLDLDIPAGFFYTAVVIYIPCWMFALFSAAFISRMSLDKAGSMVFLSLIVVLFLFLIRKDKAPFGSLRAAPKEKVASPSVSVITSPQSVGNAASDALPQQEALPPDSRLAPYALYKKRNLTKREIEIAELLLQGYQRQKIADTLFISLWTVKTHIRNIYEKLSVSSLAEFFALFRAGK